MARVVRQKDYAGRRNQILDSAQRFIYTKGYVQMTIQDILDDLGISKGAFYHYFTSKQDLLDGLIERMREQAVAILMPVIDDPALSATGKLERFFASAASWKTEHKKYVMGLLSVWYTDDNAIVRQKASEDNASFTGPLLTRIIRQGMDEGSLKPMFPEQAAGVVLALLHSMSDDMAKMVLKPVRGEAGVAQALDMTAAYTDAVERVLGACPGSVKIMSESTIRHWIEEDQA